MSDNWLYIVLPMTSAGACGYLLAKLYYRSACFEFLSLFVSLALINVTQAFAYIALPYSFSFAGYLADIYLITVYFFFSQLTLFAIALSGQHVGAQLRTIIYVFPVTLALFHFAGLMVESYRVVDGVLLHNDGVLAWLFDMLMLVTCLATVTTLWTNARSNFENKVIASKNIIALISFIPLILISIIIVLLSRTPYAISVAIVVPIITLYTAFAFYYLIRERVLAISVGLGFFMRRLKLANQLLELKNNKDEIKSFTKAIERQFIVEALEMHGGDIQATANYIGMNHTTLRNKVKEYEVVCDRDKTQVKVI